MTSQQRPGVFFTLVGPAGVGKNRLMKAILAQTDLHQLPTATTRAIRAGEQPGREHHYVSLAEFQRMIDAGELLEHQVIHEQLYGMPRAAVESALNSGEAIIADIEVLGAARACEAYPENVVSIFIEPPSIGVLIERMRERRESSAEIGKRLLRVPMELAYAPYCEYVILNDVFESAAERLYQIVRAELNHARGTVPAGQPQSYDYTYVVRVVPVFGDEALQADALSTPFNPEELPHEAALQLVSDVLGIDGSDRALIAGDQPDGGYLAPLQLDYSHADGEQITYTYGYKLDARLTPPTGGQWVLLSAALPSVMPERGGGA